MSVTFEKAFKRYRLYPTSGGKKKRAERNGIPSVPSFRHAINAVYGTEIIDSPIRTDKALIYAIGNDVLSPGEPDLENVMEIKAGSVKSELVEAFSVDLESTYDVSDIAVPFTGSVNYVMPAIMAVLWVRYGLTESDAVEMLRERLDGEVSPMAE